MFVSERFLARLAKIRKSHREAPTDEQMELVRDAFVGQLNGLPNRMADDIFELFTERMMQRADGATAFLEAAGYLSDFIDLFALQYDEQNDPLHPDDWSLIGEVVNDYAHDLDMPTVNYVMRLVVDHKGL
jgi:hypothetical protein